MELIAEGQQREAVKLAASKRDQSWIILTAI